MQNTFVIKIVSVVIFFVFGICYAEEVSVKKTFDYGNTLQYDLIYNHSNTRYILQYTTYRNGDGAHIRFDSEKRFSAFLDLKPILTKLFKKADGMNKGKITSFLVFEFLNCDDIAKKCIMSFRNHKKWAEYLIESKKKYVTPPNDFVQKAIVRNKVFGDLHVFFDLLGYELELHRIEKVFSRRADQFNCYADLKATGVLPDDMFPVPGILYFRLKYKE